MQNCAGGIKQCGKSWPRATEKRDHMFAAGRRTDVGMDEGQKCKLEQSQSSPTYCLEGEYEMYVQLQRERGLLVVKY